MVVQCLFFAVETISRCCGRHELAGKFGLQESLVGGVLYPASELYSE